MADTLAASSKVNAKTPVQSKGEVFMLLNVHGGEMAY